MLYIVLLSVKKSDVAETVTRSRSRKGMGYSDGIIIPVVSIDIGIGLVWGRESEFNPISSKRYGTNITLGNFPERWGGERGGAYT